MRTQVEEKLQSRLRRMCESQTWEQLAMVAEKAMQH